MIHLLFHLLRAKIHVITSAKIPLIAALIVLGSTGFVVTGTIEGEDVKLTVKPLENRTCFDALIAQTETLLEMDVLAADATRQLRHLRDRARENANEQNKVINESLLRTQFDAASARIPDELAAARKLVLHDDLGKCQDGDPKTSVTLDAAVLRANYSTIVRDFGKKLSGILDDAQTGFDALVATAQPKPLKQQKASGGSSSRD